MGLSKERWDYLKSMEIPRRRAEFILPYKWPQSKDSKRRKADSYRGARRNAQKKSRNEINRWTRKERWNLIMMGGK